ncbi:tlde1 domain-containing protein [Methylobacterium sp. sgz302541]|uniref:DUF2778 domain-containing protein n=1 Tax=unclassified Methylobacterium TaxID=2615210 RepID=UPI003D343038
MVNDTLPPDGAPPAPRRAASGRLALAGLSPLRAPVTAILVLVLFGGLPVSNRVPTGGDTPLPVREAVVVDAAETPDPIAPLDPESVALLRQAFRDAEQAKVAALAPEAPVESATPFARQEPAPPAQELSSQAPSLQAQMVPLPVPRPSELRANPGEPSRRADRRASRQAMAAAPAAPVEDTRSFFDKLFGAQPSPAPAGAPSAALGYAALETKPVAPPARSPFNPFSAPATGTGIAVYDISARTVVLPNGEKLEAHSGLGDAFDDPRHVHVRMRGPTPPGTYDLTEREALFHGVRAIRLTPVGGAEAVYGRNGLLAHTFMLGPRGDSNGCVSFRDYDRFLQAFLRGEVQRLVVVAGSRGDAVPRLASGGRTLRVAGAE